MIGMSSCDKNSSFQSDGITYYKTQTEVPDSIILKAYYENGSPMRIISFLGNDKHGPYIELDSMGNIKIKSEYRNNLLHGKIIYLNENGVVEFENNFKEDKRNGYQITFDKNGDTLSYNYCYRDSILYCSPSKNNKFEEQVLPDIKIEKDSIASTDTMAFRYGLPIEKSLVKDKELYLFIGIDSYKPPPANLLEPRDSFLLNTDDFKIYGLLIKEKGDLMVYGYIGDRKEGKEINYDIFRRRFYSY